MRGGCIDSALISFFGLVALTCSSRRHAPTCRKRCLHRLRLPDTAPASQSSPSLPGLLILFRQAKQNTAVDRITHQHLLEDVDS